MAKIDALRVEIDEIVERIENYIININLKKIFTDNELDGKSVVRKFRISDSDGES